MDFASEEAKLSDGSSLSSSTKHKRIGSTTSSSSFFKMPSGDLGDIKSKKKNLITKQRESIAEYLLSKRDKETNRQRSLSNHVISRWYRPPEIIFIEKKYDQSVDLWSLGCILSDMVNCC